MPASPDAPNNESRVLVFSPTGRDATLIQRVLSDAGVNAAACDTLGATRKEMQTGAGAIVLAAEEALSAPAAMLDDLVDTLKSQPPWSDLPLIALTNSGMTTQRILERLASPGTIITLERPVVMGTLLSAVRAALRARGRQYEVRDLLRVMKETDRRKDEFLAMLSHELRNPLAPIISAAHLLKSHTPDPLLERQREVIERQATQLARLLDDLLDASRITQGKIGLRMAPVAVADVMRQAVESAQALVTTRRQTLTVNAPDEPLVVTGDAARLQQALVNLLNNAAKYTEEGGGIAFSAVREGDGVLLRVRDTGMGIPADVLPHVFDLFVQSSRSLDRSQGGLGIGLTMVRRLIEMHDGSVSAESGGPGQGSTFTVRLPLAEGVGSWVPGVGPGTSAPGTQDPSPNAQHSAPNTLRRRVLVVDDSVDGAETLAELLELWGSEVTVQHDGPSALAAVAKDCPDVILLDIGLPGMDGYEVARRLRQTGGADGALLVALTGYGQDEDRRRGMDAGFAHYLTKPVNLDTLRALITTDAANG